MISRGPSGECQIGPGKAAGGALDVGEDTVAPLGLEAIERRREESLIIH